MSIGNQVNGSTVAASRGLRLLLRVWIALYMKASAPRLGATICRYASLEDIQQHVAVKQTPKFATFF